jgi:hypothetical protein
MSDLNYHARARLASLLDTLAVRFREEGWSIKRLVKEIVTSSTWRMSSSRNTGAAEQDPLNLLLHHYPLRRLEGEAVRDKILAASGRLDRTVGGQSVEVFITLACRLLLVPTSSEKPLRLKLVLPVVALAEDQFKPPSAEM